MNLTYALLGVVIFVERNEYEGVPVYFELCRRRDLVLVIQHMATVAFGELVVCYALGMPFLYALKKLPKKTLNR